MADAAAVVNNAVPSSRLCFETKLMTCTALSCVARGLEAAALRDSCGEQDGRIWSGIMHRFYRLSPLLVVPVSVEQLILRPPYTTAVCLQPSPTRRSWRHPDLEVKSSCIL